MLNQEEQKLKDEDMKKVHMRAKRLEMRKKGEIISKEKRNTESVQKLIESEKKLKEFRYQNKVKYNQELEYFSHTMGNWAQSGFKNINKESASMLATIDQKLQ